MTLAAQTARSLPLHGAPLRLLRLEGAGLLILATWFYACLGQGWLLFLVLFLVPDLSMLAYFAGPRLGAVIYNIAHTTLPPLALLGFGALAKSPAAMAVAAI